MNLDVLFEDNHCLAVNKPAGLLSQGDASGDPSLVDLATLYLKTRYKKPGTFTWGSCTGSTAPRRASFFWPRPARRPAGCRTSFGRGRSRSSTGRSSKESPVSRKGNGSTCSKKTRGKTVPVSCSRIVRSSKEARVAFRVLERSRRFTKLELRPATGRSHQLRVQLARRGLPIVGDRKYGATTSVESSRWPLQDRASRAAVDFHAPDSTGSDFGRCAGPGRLARAFERRVGVSVRLQ